MKLRQTTKQNLQKKVKSFNARLGRMAKKEIYKGVTLPRKLSVKEIEQNAGNYEDIRRVMHRVDSFMSKSIDSFVIVENSQGVKALKWDVDNMKRDAQRINMNREKERQAHPDTGSQILGFIGDLRDWRYGTKQFNFDTTSKEGFKMLQEGMKQALSGHFENMYRQYKKNYLKAAKEVVKGKKFEELKKVVNSIDDEKFYYSPIEVDYFLDFNLWYQLRGADDEQIAEGYNEVMNILGSIK